jgi:hypothetical protein
MDFQQYDRALERASYLVTAALCAWSFGLGGRMLLEFYIQHSAVYVINEFDARFDWGVLVALACITVFVNNIRLRRQENAESASRNATDASRPLIVTE